MSQTLIEKYLEKGLLISPELLAELDEGLLDKQLDQDSLIINAELKNALFQNPGMNIDWHEFERSLFLLEKKGDAKIYNEFLHYLASASSLLEETTREDDPAPVRILMQDTDEPHKRSVDDFISYFNTRFNYFEKLLKTRQELTGLTSVSRVLAKKDKDTVSVIGMIMDKAETKNNNLILTVEDRTGKISVLIHNTKQELFTLAKDCGLDEVIGVVGTNGNKIIFAENILLPNIPLGKELRKSRQEGYVLFMGDLHVGSKYFLKGAFERFLNWIAGKAGNDEQKRLASLVKYIIIVGDLVEGIGVYPSQEDDLEILSMKDQYAEFSRLIARIPQHIKIICLPGNHDAGRISEPQPPIYKDFAEAVWQLPNVIMLGNPCLINIDARLGFPGFDILLYHGYSLIYYAETVPSIKEAGGQKRVDLVMRHLLQRRHLSPSHSSNLYVPYPHKDSLIIDRIPDFFITGHVHRLSVANYRAVTLINCSCWTGITEDQEKRGLEPQPGKLPLVNLQTREIKVMNFLTKEEEKEAEV
ncbi:MAG: metallophosphoesterase [Nanoarchaeota archaeon]